MKPPANESPAPVGSFTSSSSSAGAPKTPCSETRMTPCSPFLMMTPLGPFAMIVAGGGEQAAGARRTARTSWSLMVMMFERRIASVSCGFGVSIQRFIESSTTSFGASTCSCTAIWSVGRMLARKTYSAVAVAGRQLGLEVGEHARASSPGCRGCSCRSGSAPPRRTSRPGLRWRPSRLTPFLSSRAMCSSG